MRTKWRNRIFGSGIAGVILLCTALPCAAQSNALSEPKLLRPPQLADRDGISLAAVEPIPETRPLGPPEPSDPKAAAAFRVLDRHCARCHQEERAGAPSQLSYPHDILDLEAIARTPTLISPGRPDGSLLYQLMAERRMPPSAQLAKSSRPEPTADDVAAIRAWIESLDANGTYCADREMITPVAVAKALNAWLATLDRIAARDTRFISLAHLYNDCASAKEMTTYRQALITALSSLSWSPLPARIHTVGEHHAVMAFRLADVGWVDAHWQRIAELAPAHTGALSDGAAALTGSSIPIVPGDWLVATLMRPPFYYDLLGLPRTVDELARLLRVPVTKNLSDAASSRVKRVGITHSQLTGGHRLAERHALDDRTFWRIFDLAIKPRKASLLQTPLSPEQNGPSVDTFDARAQRIIFSLPNGLPAYVLADGNGKRIGQLSVTTSPGVASTDISLETEVGLGCMSCHHKGLKPMTDEVRKKVTSPEFKGAQETRDRVQRLHAGSREMHKLIAADNAAMRSALKSAGVDPSRRLRKQTPMRALARRHMEPVSLQRASAELAIEPPRLIEKLNAHKGPLADEARILSLGTIPRHKFETLAAAMTGARISGTEQPQGPRVDMAAPDAKRRRLDVWAQKSVFKIGDLVSFYARTDEDCYLTIVSIDKAGQATVLFPNDFERVNLLRAGVKIRVPDPKADYQLRFKERGKETLVGICTADFERPPGITPDYSRQRFTVLGKWNEHVLNAFAADDRAARGKAPPKPNRRRQIRGVKPPKPQPDRAGRPAPLTQTEITIEIR